MSNIFFLGRVLEGTARGYSVEANLEYIRDVIAVLGLEDSRPVSTPSVKRTPTTESLVELENEKRAVYRTAVGKLLVCGRSVPTSCTASRKQQERTRVPQRATRGT